MSLCCRSRSGKGRSYWNFFSIGKLKRTSRAGMQRRIYRLKWKESRKISTTLWERLFTVKLFDACRVKLLPYYPLFSRVPLLPFYSLFYRPKALLTLHSRYVPQFCVIRSLARALTRADLFPALAVCGTIFPIPHRMRCFVPSTSTVFVRHRSSSFFHCCRLPVCSAVLLFS